MIHRVSLTGAYSVINPDLVLGRECLARVARDKGKPRAARHWLQDQANLVVEAVPGQAGHARMEIRVLNSTATCTHSLTRGQSGRPASLRRVWQPENDVEGPGI